MKADAYSGTQTSPHIDLAFDLDHWQFRLAKVNLNGRGREQHRQLWAGQRSTKKLDEGHYAGVKTVALWVHHLIPPSALNQNPSAPSGYRARGERNQLFEPQQDHLKGGP